MLSTIAIGSDHAGFHLKAEIIEVLNNQGIKTIDKGCYSEESVDYPDIAHGVVDEIYTKKASRGIVICGSGNGINMSANKHAFIRSALCWEPEIASLAVEHNNANILALPARFISESKALECLQAFISSKFEGGRHERRVGKISPC
jgi:ribose 5-phosphate isomerase B|tara:strand:+ start:331 stop:768 length:438 start_codon:yes stop_codon:yes gene_type:complete